jgi:hypothetical protein
MAHSAPASDRNSSPLTIRSRKQRLPPDTPNLQAVPFAPQTKSTRKFDDEAIKQAVFQTLHEPPSNHGINRTTWIMPDLSRILRENGHPACPEVIRKITKAAGYRWRKARTVLTSSDPEYIEKVDRIHSILSGLCPDEAFFSIDEFGPFAVKMQPGRALCPPGKQRVVPQWQKSRGCLIMTAALELSGNQVTHFYSSKKNTAEMIRMMEVLVERYRDRRKLYLSWDAASWHVSKRLNQRIKEHNATVLNASGPTVEAAPLPSGVQLRIPTDASRAFRRKAAGDSEGSQPLIPRHSSHP